MARAFDPEFLYAECGRCGRQVGPDTSRPQDSGGWSGASLARLDTHGMLLSDGCSQCSPLETAFATRFVHVLPGPASGSRQAGRAEIKAGPPVP